jgi:phage terminase large subunit-like protein
MDSERPDDLDAELARLEELERLTKTLYVPHPKQKAFHCAPNTVRAVFGGNRSGKSEMGVNEARFHATGRYPDWYPESKRWNHPTRGRIVVTDYKKGGGEVVEPKIRQWFDPETIVKCEKSMGNLVKVHIQHISGGISTFDIMTHEQDTMQFEGWSGHWVWFDEPPPRDKYIACLRGLVDFRGRAFITATPITEPWLYDEIMLNTEQDCWHIAVSIYDNPFLSEEGRKILIGSLTDEEKEARVHGKFLHLTGRVYKDLDTNIHLVDSLPFGSHAWPVYFVLDPADRRPHHGIWAKVDPFGTIYVFDELVYKGTIKDTSKEILIRERTNHVRPMEVIRILDPNKGQTPTAATGLRLIDEFASHAVYFTATVNDDIALGHLAVKERLSYDKNQRVSSTNHPKIYFVREKTRECVKQLMSYVWDDWRGRSGADKSQKEKVKDINKDMPDCVRYLCMSNPTFFTQDDSETLPRSFSGTGYGPQ